MKQLLGTAQNTQLNPLTPVLSNVGFYRYDYKFNLYSHGSTHEDSELPPVVPIRMWLSSAPPSIEGMEVVVSGHYDGDGFFHASKVEVATLRFTIRPAAHIGFLVGVVLPAILLLVACVIAYHMSNLFSLDFFRTSSSSMGTLIRVEDVDLGRFYRSAFIGSTFFAALVVLAGHLFSRYVRLSRQRAGHRPGTFWSLPLDMQFMSVVAVVLVPVTVFHALTWVWLLFFPISLVRSQFTVNPWFDVVSVPTSILLAYLAFGLLVAVPISAYATWKSQVRKLPVFLVFVGSSALFALFLVRFGLAFSAEFARYQTILSERGITGWLSTVGTVVRDGDIVFRAIFERSGSLFLRSQTPLASMILIVVCYVSIWIHYFLYQVRRYSTSTRE